MSCLAALDLGSNTFRLMIAEETSFPPFYSIRHIERVVVRMAEGVEKTKEFSFEKINSGIDVLITFKEQISQCAGYRAVATGVFREAKNSDLFVKRAEEEGIDIEIISPGIEAQLSFMGAVNEVGFLDKPTNFLDIGGGSFEVATSSGKEFFWSSYPWGAVKLQNKFHFSTPSDPAKIEEARSFLGKLFDEVYNKFKFVGEINIVTGGTISTLIMLELGLETYKREILNSFKIDLKLVEKWLKRLLPLSLEGRSKIAGMERGREDIIITGLLILESFLKKIGGEAINSEGGLLEGVWLSLKERRENA